MQLIVSQTACRVTIFAGRGIENLGLTHHMEPTGSIVPGWRSMAFGAAAHMELFCGFSLQSRSQYVLMVISSPKSRGRLMAIARLERRSGTSRSRSQGALALHNFQTSQTWNCHWPACAYFKLPLICCPERGVNDL